MSLTGVARAAAQPLESKSARPDTGKSETYRTAGGKAARVSRLFNGMF